MVRLFVRECFCSYCVPGRITKLGVSHYKLKHVDSVNKTSDTVFKLKDSVYEKLDKVAN